MSSLKQKIQEKIDACGDTTIRSMHDNVKAKIAVQNRKEAFTEVLGLLDEATKQLELKSFSVMIPIVIPSHDPQYNTVKKMKVSVIRKEEVLAVLEGAEQK